MACTDQKKGKMKNRYLKRHAVPSVFPWSDAPPTASQDEKTADSKSEKKNAESGNILHTNNGNTTEKLSSEIGTSSSLEMEKDYEKDIPSAAKKSHTTLNKPFRYDFTPGPSCVPSEEARFQEPPSVQESERHSSEPNNSLTEIEIDIGNDIETTDSVQVKQENDDSDNSVKFTKPCASCGHLPYYSVHSYKNEPNGVNFYTGLDSFDKLMSVFNSLGDGVNNLNYGLDRQPPEHLDALEQFCMVLLILSRHREVQDVAMTYRITTKQVANIFTTWIRFMALQWRTVKLEFDRKAISYYMSLDYNDKYHARDVIDANECLDRNPRLLSAYENRNTVKNLIGMATNGLITYLAPCSSDSDSNRQVDERSSSNDEMDKVLSVQDIFLSHGIKVGPTASKKYNQANPDFLTRAKKSADKSVHVERIVEMLKSYKILTERMSHTETAVASEIAFVVAMLVNFRSNLVK
ncbi:uncharacterized protein [Maniola hyperantus]|uniref:uncharacterized protein isoform X2 n=1 Tax=Aphantopus hyperantus TaxID=2795564 RepID=UPI003749CCE6